MLGSFSGPVPGFENGPLEATKHLISGDSKLAAKWPLRGQNTIGHGQAVANFKSAHFLSAAQNFDHILIAPFCACSNLQHPTF